MENTSQANKVQVQLSTVQVDKLDMQELLAFGNQIASSKIVPLKTGGDVAAAILMGREIGLTPMVSVNNIYPINGKASLGIHVILALLVKAGITYEILNDCQPMYSIVVKPDKEGDPYLVVRSAFKNEPREEGEGIGSKPVDIGTRIVFNRMIKQPDGSWKNSSVTITYTKNEADLADLTRKDNWKNHFKTMLRNRALAIGGRLIGPDVLMGVYETSELADSYNIPYTVEDGKVTIIDSNSNPQSEINVQHEPSTVEFEEKEGEKITNEK